MANLYLQPKQENMISRNFFSALFLIAFFISNSAKAQTPTTDNVYLWSAINTPETTAVATPYFSAKIRSPFTLDDYNKLMQLSAQRVWNHTKAGDSLVNIDWVFGFGPFFNQERSVISAENMTESDLKNDPTILAPLWPSNDIIGSWDRFHLKNGMAVGAKVSVGPDYRFVVRTDSESVVGKNGKKTLKVVKKYLDANKAEMMFMEKWSFDPMSGIFGKNVNAFGFLQLKQDPTTGEKIGYSPLIFLENTNGNYNPATDVLLKKNVICDESVESNEVNMESDSMWMNSKPNEVIENLEYGLANIPFSERAKFLSSIFYYVFHNPSKVFPSKNMAIDSLHPFHSALEIQNLFCSWDSSHQMEDPLNPGNIILAPIRLDVQLGNIYAIRFYEDWYYDPKEMTIKKHVNGIGFIIIQKNQMDFPVPLFRDAGIYVKLN